MPSHERPLAASGGRRIGRAQAMTRLASPIEAIGGDYEVVVVGSGYGGAIAASRMARAGRRVCLLERGKELQPGDYPDAMTEALAELQVDSKEGHLGKRTALYDFRRNEDMNVFQGCGLGGTSLVNANVALPAEDRVFDDERWPQPLRGRPSALDEGYRRAREMLRPAPFPDEFPELKKLEALKTAGAYLGGDFYRPPIAVNFRDGVNHVGVYQPACPLVGDCVTGCNYGAKNTTLMNYLPDARNHGAEIYTEVSVRSLEPRDGGWLVHYDVLDAGREKFGAPELFVRADVVILGAGSLGSTEILLRSAQRGLALSPHVGQRFTGNGDVIGFGYNCDEPILGIGFGDHAVGELPPVGPCITGIVDMRENPALDSGMVIEEGVAPGAISALLARVFPVAAKAFGADTDAGLLDFVGERARELESMVGGAYRGALSNTMTYLVMTHDDSGGRMRLEDDRLRIDWPGVGRQAIFQTVHERLLRATEALGGTYMKNPIWSQLLGQDLVTVHPLGGCPMAEEAASGVVNQKGQVFSGPSGSDVHDGLYVCDGAIVPRSLGVNPLLTISALAERCCELLAADRGWRIEYALPSAAPAAPPAPAPSPARPGVKFTETMRGYFSTAVTDDFERAAERGRADESPLRFTLTIVADDLDRLIEDDRHEARIVGSVEAPALSDHPLTATDGLFNLFVADPADADTRRMRYRMKLSSQEGKSFYFEGFKIARDDLGPDMWTDLTTLFITVHEGDSDAAPVLGRGILRIRPDDFIKQLTTMAATDAEGARARLAATGRFGAHFAASIKDVYGAF